MTRLQLVSLSNFVIAIPGRVYRPATAAFRFGCHIPIERNKNCSPKQQSVYKKTLTTKHNLTSIPYTLA